MEFAEPVQLTVGYDEGSLPVDLSEADLTLLSEHGGEWNEAPSTVDETAMDAGGDSGSTALTSGFERRFPSRG